MIYGIGKIKSFVVLLAAVTLCMGACKKGGFEEEMNVWPLSLGEVDATGGTFTVHVETNAIWIVNAAELEERGWISVSQATGVKDGSFDVTVQPNNRIRVREDTVKVSLSRSKETFNVIVKQRPPATVQPEIRLTPASLKELMANGGNYNVELSGNAAWKVFDIPAWLTVSPSEGTLDADGLADKRLTITYDPNPQTTERKATLKFRAQGQISHALEVELELEQYGAKAQTLLNVTPSNFSNVPADGQTYDMTINVEAGVVWTVSELPAWCAVDKASDTGPAVVKLTVAANDSEEPRDSRFRVRAGDAYRPVDVSQKGKEAAPPQP